MKTATGAEAKKMAEKETLEAALARLVATNGAAFLEERDNFQKTAAIDSACIFRQENVAENPTFTIAIPTYKRIDTLKEAIDSALNQQFDLVGAADSADSMNLGATGGGQEQDSRKKNNRLEARDSQDSADSKDSQDSPRGLNYEIIVVDDTGFDQDSPAQTFLEGNYKGKLTYYKNTRNLGTFNCWNRCLTLARGAWVCILHDDDVLLPNYLAEMQKAIAKVAPDTSLISHRAIYFGNLALIGEPPQNRLKTLLKRHAKPLFVALKAAKNALLRGVIYKILGVKTYGTLEPRSADYIAAYNPLHPSALLHNRAKCLALGGYNDAFYPSDDWYFHTRAARVFSVYQLDKFLSKYRWGINETFNKNVMILGNVTDYIHTRDNVPASARLKAVFAQMRYEKILKNTNVEVREAQLESLRKLGFTPHSITALDRLRYKIFMLHCQERFDCE